MPRVQSTRWCFTINNYLPGDVEHLRSLGESVRYLVFGKEVAPTTLTPHLQGFIIFNSNKNFENAKLAVCPARCHIDITQRTSAQAAAYCKKDNDFEEFGQLPGPVGRTNIAEEFREWVLEQPSKPTFRQVCDSRFLSMVLSGRRVMEVIDAIYPVVPVQQGEFRAHQQALYDLLLEDPDDRKIVFVVDKVGNTGKSWFSKKFRSLHPDSTQQLHVGKNADVSYILDISKRLFFFDVQRGQSEYLQYPFLEGLKDGYIFSPKYQSTVKEFVHKVHVVVFMNEDPKPEALSGDRYKIIRWQTPTSG